MKTEKVYLALGSNIAPRRAYLAQAFFFLDQELGVHPEAVSSMYENPAQGFAGGDFINCVARYALSGIEPGRLLEICKEVERRLGRKGGAEYDEHGGRLYRDRQVDIDIILFGDRHIDTPELQIPHPRMKERDFVMLPLKEVIEDK